MPGFALYTLAVALLAQPIEVHLAPDQPAGLFFTDEPLVVQFAAADTVTISASVTATLPNGEQTSWSADRLLLTGGRPRWHAIESLPVVRGPHAFHVQAGVPGHQVEFEQTLVRIDRPYESSIGVTGVHVHNPTRAMLYALRCLPAASVRLDVDTPKIEMVAREVEENTPGRLYLRVVRRPPGDGPDLDALSADLSGVVDLWEIAGAQGPAEYEAVAREIRRGDPGAQFAARVPGAREAVALLKGTPETRPNAFVVSANAADAVEQATSRAGVEGISLIIEFSPDVDDDAGPVPLVPRILDAVMAPRREAIVPQRIFETPSGFSWALPVLASATRQLDGSEMLEPLDTEGENRAWLFGRPGDAEPAEWLVVMTFEDPAEPVPTIPVQDAAYWSLKDANGNEAAASATPGTEIGSPPAPGLWFVRGSGGTLLTDAHVNRMKRHAAATSPHEAALKTVAPNAAIALRLLADYAYPAPTRLQFFSIVRCLPDIEEAWHRGVIEPRDAVPLLGRLSAVARELAVIEQESGDEFLEPLERTYSNCEALLKAFHSAEEGADAQRVGFLRGEVERLLKQARACEAVGRITEAKGVAALAEWRARCLEPAARIPLFDTSDEEPPDDAVESEDESGDAEASEAPAPDEVEP